MQTTALLGALVGLILSPALSLAGEELVFEPDFSFEAFEAVAGVEDSGTSEEATGEEAAAEEAAEDYDDSDPEAMTDAVVVDFNDAVSFCGAIEAEEYVVDCLSERLSVIAASLPETGEFAEMRTAIAQASRDLGALAAQNPSDTLATGVARSDSDVTSRPLRPVSTETLPATLQAADAIVAQAQVVLLRSSTNSQGRSLDYQRVAAVVGTTRSLLRSA